MMSNKQKRYKINPDAACVGRAHQLKPTQLNLIKSKLYA